jgi:uncharacterized protein involved in exopolysaccharide biosynthesis
VLKRPTYTARLRPIVTVALASVAAIVFVAFSGPVFHRAKRYSAVATVQITNRSSRPCTLRITSRGIGVDGDPTPSRAAIESCKHTAGAVAVLDLAHGDTR